MKRSEIITRILLLALLAAFAVQIVTNGDNTEKLCDGITDYLVVGRERSEKRLMEIEYYRQHPDEAEAQLAEQTRDIARFAKDVCGSL